MATDPSLRQGPTSARTRETWVDIAKGIAILLVVLFHAIIFADRIGLAWLWPTPALLLDTFRMPLFFFTAGLFAGKALAGGFGRLVRTRVIRLVWIYVLWTLIWIVVFAFVAVPGSLAPLPPLQQLLLMFVWPNASTWFVYALAVFFIATWAIRGLPVWLQLTLAAALSLAFGTQLVDSGNNALDKMGMYYVFFLVAAIRGADFRAHAERVRAWHFACVLVVYAAILVPVARLGFINAPFARLVLGALAIAVGCTGAIVLARIVWFRWLEYLGTRTLPIYLVHFYPILLIVVLLEPVSSRLVWAAPAIPPLLTVIAVLVALAFYRVTRRVPLLYDPPKSWVRPRDATAAPDRAVG